MGLFRLRRRAMRSLVFAMVAALLLALLVALAVLWPTLGDDVTLRHGGGVRPQELPSAWPGAPPFLAYFAIPYARPPVGELRFQPPRPANRWFGVRHEKKESSSCLQSLKVFDSDDGSEDCLYLNVYMNRPAGEKKSAPRAVMVWIHGGGFNMGSGDRLIYGPDFLVRHDVILVTFNYRLSVFGFLNTESSVVSGNMGLKDMILALRWIQENIASFGGDPRNVTIFGESAGAASVQYLMLSPMATGLFHRAISQSGSVLNPWAFDSHPQSKFNQLSRHMGCNISEPEVAVECLRNITAEDLMDGVKHSVYGQAVLEGVPIAFLPSLDSNSDKGDVFLPGKPLKLLQQGKFIKVPYISGLNLKEGLLIAALTVGNSTLNATQNELDHFLKSAVSSGVDLAFSLKSVRETYSSLYPDPKDTFLKYIDLMTDFAFFEGIQKSLELMSTDKTPPVYQYLFEYDGPLGFMKEVLSLPAIKGPCHAEDLGYLFKTSFQKNLTSLNSTDLVAVERMTKLWTDFAKTGNPTPGEEGIEGVKWLPFDTTDRGYLKIDSIMSFEKNLWPERRELWHKLSGFFHF